MLGWIKIHRKLQNNKLWLSEPFDRCRAWIDLLMIANYKDGYVRVAGKRIPIKRGQCGWSEQKLAARWGWSRGKIRRFLGELKSDHRIAQLTVQHFNVITICNYEEYQSDEKETVQQTEQLTVQQTDTNKEELRKKVVVGNAYEGFVVKLTHEEYVGLKNTYHSFPDLNAEIAAIDAKCRMKHMREFWPYLHETLRSRQEERLKTMKPKLPQVGGAEWNARR